MRQCIGCGKLFDPNFSILCEDCEPLWSYPTYAAIVRQTAQDLMIKTCPVCNNDFWWTPDKRRIRKYCSDRCAKKAKKAADKIRRVKK